MGEGGHLRFSRAKAVVFGGRILKNTSRNGVLLQDPLMQLLRPDN
jgi:hypothetical protein